MLGRSVFSMSHATCTVVLTLSFRHQFSQRPCNSFLSENKSTFRIRSTLSPCMCMESSVLDRLHFITSLPLLEFEHLTSLRHESVERVEFILSSYRFYEWNPRMNSNATCWTFCTISWRFSATVYSVSQHWLYDRFITPDGNQLWHSLLMLSVKARLKLLSKQKTYARKAEMKPKKDTWSIDSKHSNCILMHESDCVEWLVQHPFIIFILRKSFKDD
jgi:hypothetical protein